MLNNFKFDTIVGMVLDDTYNCAVFEERVFSTYPRRRVYISCTMLMLDLKQKRWAIYTIRVSCAYLFMPMQKVLGSLLYLLLVYKIRVVLEKRSYF